LDTGVTLQKVKVAVAFLRKNQVDLKSTILVSDGKNIYATNRGEDVSYLLSSGQGVFGLSIGHVYSNLEKSLDVMKPDLAYKFKLKKVI
jgi:hypothetical protein